MNPRHLHRTAFLQHYHKRSNIETPFHMIKSKFGQRLRSKTLTAQIKEALCKVLCHSVTPHKVTFRLGVNIEKA